MTLSSSFKVLKCKLLKIIFSAKQNKCAVPSCFFLLNDNNFIALETSLGLAELVRMHTDAYVFAYVIEYVDNQEYQCLPILHWDLTSPRQLQMSNYVM